MTERTPSPFAHLPAELRGRISRALSLAVVAELSAMKAEAAAEDAREDAENTSRRDVGSASET